MDRNTAITELQNDIAEMEAFIAELDPAEVADWTAILDAQRSQLAALQAGAPFSTVAITGIWSVR